MHLLRPILWAYICTIFCLFHVSTAFQAASGAQQLPDAIFAPNTYEVLSIREEGDEDVVRLRKRGDQEDCSTDCLDYSGWSEDGLMHCPSEVLEDLEDILDFGDVLDKRSSAKKAKRKEVTVCENVSVDGVLQTAGIVIFSPNPQTVPRLEKTYSRVYDTGDPTDPFSLQWFNLEKRSKRWTNDVVGRTDKNGNNPRRCYDAEHVLEWQILADFIKSDKDRVDGKDTICAHLHKYFIQPMPSLKKNHLVKRAKDKGKLDNASQRFEYEDYEYEFGKWKSADYPDPRPIDWIGHQWPGKSRGEPPNPWEYEMVVLNKEANVRKEVVWSPSKENIFPDPKVDNGVMKEIQENSRTLEWLFENRYYEQKTTKFWEDNKGTCKAVYMYNTAMSVAQYHFDPFIREVMRAHVTRIGEAWEYLEKTILVDPTNGNVAYKERGLKEEWLAWMKTTHKDQIDALKKALDDKIDVFSSKLGFKTHVPRWDHAGIFRREVAVPQCGYEKDKQKMEKRVQLLKDFYNGQYQNKKPESTLVID